MSPALSPEGFSLAYGLIDDSGLLTGADASFRERFERACETVSGETLQQALETARRMGCALLHAGEGQTFRICALPDAGTTECLIADGTSFSEPAAGALAGLLVQNRKLQSALSEKEGLFAALVDQSPYGVYICQNNLVRFANRALAQLFRFASPTDMADMISQEDLIAPEDRPSAAEQRRMICHSGVAAAMFTASRHDGSNFVAQLHEQTVTFEGQPACLGILFDISERQQMENELQRRASCDPLTGLPNRTLLFDRLQQMIARARREDHLFALLFLDLDDFKQVNKADGQEVGDQVLRIAAERFASALRSSDTLARVGSDEFAVIAESLMFGDDVGTVAQKLCEALAPPISVAGNTFRLTVSIGVALFPASGENADGLYRAADAALRIAKDTRRGGYILSPGLVK